MRVARLNKRSFLDLLGGSLSLVTHSTLPKYAPEEDELFAVWDDLSTERSLPSAIIVNDKAMRDFLAWSSTFIGTIKPFTAFVRVIPFSILSDFIKEKRPSFEEYDSACAAMIIAEALSNAPEKMHPNTLTPLICGSTYSYSLARAFACNLSFDSYTRIVEKISVVRKLSGQPPRKVSPLHILSIWYVLYSLKCDSKNVIFSDQMMNLFVDSLSKLESSSFKEIRYFLQYICDAFYQFQQFGDIDPKTLRKFSNFFSQDSYQGWDRNKESNVINFKTLMNAIATETERPAFVTGLLCGYLANKVAPGSFSHVDLVWPYLDKYPTTLLWYALFAGLSKKTDILSSSDCLPLRVIRDLLTPFGLLVVPSGDISVDELEVLLSENSKEFSFKHGYAGHLQIEVVPNIITKVKWVEPSKPQISQPSASKPSYSVGAIEEMGYLLRKMEEVYSELTGGAKLNHYLVTKSPKVKSKKEPKQGKLIE